MNSVHPGDDRSAASSDLRSELPPGKKAGDALYRFHWRSGRHSDGWGRDVADAFGRLGYGGGAIAALDYYEILSARPQAEGKPGDDAAGANQ